MKLKKIDEDFIYRFLAGEANGEEEKAFRQKLMEDTELCKEVERVERSWYLGKYARKWGQVDERKAWHNIVGMHSRRVRHKRILYWNIAALLGVIVGAGIFTLLRYQSDAPLRLVEEVCQIQPGQSKALLVLTSGEKIELGAMIPKKISDGGIVIEGDSASLIYTHQTEPAEFLFNELIIPVGGEYRLCLSDGTVIYLNAESKLRYPVNFGKGEREVELEGEAYFEVAPDKERPFQVRTSDLDVRVLGTGFNVSAYRNGYRSEVTLAHGAVIVEKAGKELALKPDEQFVADKQSGKMFVQTVDAWKICGWKSGILYFEGMPLEELAVKLSRWYGVQFFFTSEKLKQLKFTGALKKYDSIDYVLSLIEATTDIRVQIKDRIIMVDSK